MNRLKTLSVITAAALTMASAAMGRALPSSSHTLQDGGSEDRIALAPVRFELPILPGTEQTVVVNAIYNSASAEAEPYRLAASLGDWSISKTGEVDYYRAGTQPNSACPWMVYSPAEASVQPGKPHPIRVTISVPKDATPGDHLAALFVESRPENLEPGTSVRQVTMRIRLAALFYIMVPELTRKGSVPDLKAEAVDGGIVVTPTLKNEGNSHLRPLHRIRIINSDGATVLETPYTESIPVLGNSEVSLPLSIETVLPPGQYSILYEVDFKDGGASIYARGDILVKPKSSG
ncbi:MAG: hypothetical protein L0229_10340 [Blastocatellia bacterium]|nr:hypothetical protein [Blastocatellia bacterium]